MRILIVCEKFAPENTVGAIRMTKVSKYLSLQMDAQIDVLTRKKEDGFQCCEDYLNNVYYAEESGFDRLIINSYKRYSSSNSYSKIRREEVDQINQKKSEVGIKKLKIWCRSIVAVLWSEYTARAYARNAVRQVSANQYDVIISSFGPESSHYIGRYLKNKHPKAIWIADYRDPLYSGEATKGFLVYWAKNFPNRITKKADAITTVSKGFVQCLNVQARKNVFVINNGFDKDDLNGIELSKCKMDKLEFAYIGSLLVGRRDITPFLNALFELIKEGKIDKNQIRLSYAGNDWKEFDLQLAKVRLPIEVKNYKKIPKKQALQMEVNADVLLMAAWNTKEYTGSLPLKLYEYMMVGRPIICVVSGNGVNSELKEVIDRCGVGYCYETMGGKKEYEKMKACILRVYHAHIEGRLCEIVQGYQSNEIEKYDYKYLSGRFVKIIEQLQRR